MSKKVTIEELDARIEALKEVKRKKVNEQKKRQALELKNREIESNRILRASMNDYLRSKKIYTDDDIIELGVDRVNAAIFGKTSDRPSAGAQ